jgi:hypothetical protein
MCKRVDDRWMDRWMDNASNGARGGVSDVFAENDASGVPESILWMQWKLN